MRRSDPGGEGFSEVHKKMIWGGEGRHLVSIWGKIGNFLPHFCQSGQ